MKYSIFISVKVEVRTTQKKERKKELLSFAAAWMELESILLSEISQVAKGKYHMISPISGLLSTKQTNEQNKTRDMEIRNKLTVTRWEGRGIMREKRGKVWSRNMYKRLIDMDNRVGTDCGSRVCG